MKSIIIILSLLFGFAAKAQDKGGVKTEKIKVAGVCDMCKERIEKAAMFTKGVKKATWDPETGIMEVIYRSDKTSRSDIAMQVAKAGYDTDSVKADESAYSKLPNCCQYRTTPKH